MKNQLRNDAWGPTIFWVWPLQDSSKELCRKVMERQYENYKDVIVDQDCRDCRVSRDQPGFGAAKWYEWILSIHKLGRGAITMI